MIEPLLRRTALLLLSLVSAIPCASVSAQDTPPLPSAPPRTGGAPPSTDAFKYGSPPSLAPGTTEQQMWPAATAEGWRKPCLITWQRCFDDALRTAKASGKPILVAVNMDGEIASEHFAGVRYRDPETAKLMNAYVCIVASVYRHTVRDYDELGRRVECPRFGTVTCAEHIAAEVELYAKYFEGQRISPRHIALELDGSKMYDVYYSWDTQTVFTAYAKGVEGRTPPIPREPGPLAQRTQSADITDRLAIESAYREGDRETRRVLLQTLVQKREVDQVELLRQAIFGLDLELARIARQALARCETEAAVDLIAEALKVPMEKDERAALLAAAARLGEKFPRARTLTSLHHGLAQGSKWVDPKALAEAPARQAYESQRLEQVAQTAEMRAQDAQARLSLAESLLDRSRESPSDPRFARVLLEDADATAKQARALGASGWRLDATQAVTRSLLGDASGARSHALAAVEGGMLRSMQGDEAPNQDTLVAVLALFAQARQEAIRKAYREKAAWPPEWLADIDSTYATLVGHEQVSEDNYVSYYDFLRWLGGTPRANRVLEDALARFPDSALLHERLRSQLLWERGATGLQSAYAARLNSGEPTPQLRWYAGYASLVAAEHFRRGGQLDQALAAYAQGIELYEQSAKGLPDGGDLCAHFIAIALAGQARIALERGELPRAADDLLACFQRRPDSAGSPDGLNITPIETARMLLAKLADEPDAPLAARVQAGLDTLDPKLLEPPPSERAVPDRRARGQRR